MERQRKRVREREFYTLRCPLSSTDSAAGGASVPGTQQPACVSTNPRETHNVLIIHIRGHVGDPSLKCFQGTSSPANFIFLFSSKEHSSTLGGQTRIKDITGSYAGALPLFFIWHVKCQIHMAKCKTRRLVWTEVEGTEHEEQSIRGNRGTKRDFVNSQV